MSYLSPKMPVPEPDIDDAQFWEAAAAGRLVFQRCVDCGVHRHPPSPMCPRCQSTAVGWTEAPGRGILFSYTTTHVVPHPELRGRAPYVVALVSFPTLDDVRLVTNIINGTPETLRIGASVALAWEPLGEDLQAPRFSIVSAGDEAAT